MTKESYKQHQKNRKEAHEKICPKRELTEGEKRRRKERRDPQNRKIAVCLGCGKPNNSCTCSDHLKPHIETQITYNWEAAKKEE